MTRPKRTFKKQRCGACNGTGKRLENFGTSSEPKMVKQMCIWCYGTGRVRKT